MASLGPEIIIYADRQCPFAHRVYIALAELKLPFKEEHIDVSVPRTEAYLKINPSGKIPSLSYDGEVLTESGIIARFLTDAHPSHLIPPSDSKTGALKRARVDFFVQTYEEKVLSFVHKFMFTPSSEEADDAAASLSRNIVHDIEPLLVDTKPFFNGSETLTLAEVLTASFVLRLFSLMNHGILPKSTLDVIDSHAPHFTAWAQVIRETPNVAAIYNENVWITKVGEKIDEARG